MRASALLLCLLLSLHAAARPGDSLSAPNLIIITIDGLRWQEVFHGPDEAILGEGSYVADTGLIREMYWDADQEVRRRRLMPFFWNVIARKGQLYGNRDHGNRMNVSNRYKFSYPGYNEIFTGYADSRFVPNTPVLNKNTNILEFLNKQHCYKEKVAAFSSWNIFPFILNEKRSGIPVNSGYESLNDTDPLSMTIDSLQQAIGGKAHTRYDELTFISAREYIRKQHPKVALVAFGEADEFAHHGHYDHYLRSIANTDRMIAELWYEIQSDPFYRNNTTFLITTDHGRGRKTRTWTDHLFLIGGSREIWMAVMGPGIRPLGEMKTEQVIYQKQIAATIARLLGQQFECEHSVGRYINLPGMVGEANAQDGIALDRP